MPSNENRPGNSEAAPKSARTNTERNAPPRFIRVEAPGRCGTCSWHVATQRHHPQCPGGTVAEKSAESNDSAADFVANIKGNDAVWKAFARPVKRVMPRRTRTGRGYELAALRGECEKVAKAIHGSRNMSLNAYTFKLRKKYVDRGELTNDEVAQAMFDAAQKCGLVRDKGASAVVASIASGLGISKSELRWLT